MRTNIDFSPFYRSSIGFDRIFDLLEKSAPPQVDNWPPYDIAKLGEDTYRIIVAVAGFVEGELTITHKPNLLMMIEGSKTENNEIAYLHHGLALRPFTRRFELADHVSVTSAKLENGLLTIDLKKEIPEEMKPRRISINTIPDKGTASKQIASDAAA